jgi:hypothetical protein
VPHSSYSFTVDLSARDPCTGKTASGKVIPQNDFSATCRSPYPTNNLFAKVLDGTKINGRYWIF